VDTGIGATLREARNRRKVELSEVEAAIKIRVRYLRAIENEEWDVLPGVAYTRGFIRTYAYYLGLDGERLADEYRHGVAPAAADRVPKRVEPVPTAVRGQERRTSSRLVVAAVCLALVALAAGIALAGGGGGDSSSTTAPAGESRGNAEQQRSGQSTPVSKPGVTMRLIATGEVWTCLLDADRKPLVDGEILAAGSEAGPFRGEGFELALGNGSAELFVDGTPAEIAESSSPVGYRIDSDGRLTALEEGERPDCE
jgi:cytoskeleton protein RodZ